jgi:beta-barrel assembly-enhancing protease
MAAARWLIALVIAAFGTLSYCTNTSDNPITGEKQRVALSAEEEVALGRQLAPQMAAQFGGASASAARERVRQIGARVVSRSSAANTPYQYAFHLLADRKTVNAFALPGGQIFITEALLAMLKTEDEVAAVLGHEVGHVLARHSAEHLAKQQLTQQLVGAVIIGSGSYETAQLAQIAGSLINMKHGRDDEHESDALGLRLVREAGYDPSAMIRVMQVLEEASGGSGQPEFASTHPSSANRIARIREHLEKMK